MKREYNIFYEDGCYYGNITIKGNKRTAMKIIKAEILENNKNVNKDYHITRKCFKRA